METATMTPPAVNEPPKRSRRQRTEKPEGKPIDGITFLGKTYAILNGRPVITAIELRQVTDFLLSRGVFGRMVGAAVGQGKLTASPDGFIVSIGAISTGDIAHAIDNWHKAYMTRYPEQSENHAELLKELRAQNSQEHISNIGNGFMLLHRAGFNGDIVVNGNSYGAQNARGILAIMLANNNLTVGQTRKALVPIV